MAHYRTEVIDACTDGVEVTGEALYEIADCGLTGTLRAIENDAPLLDFDEYEAI